MRYYVTVDGKSMEVDLTGDAPVVDGQRVEAELSRVPGTPTLHLLADGRSHVVVATRRDRHNLELHLNGERYDVEVVDERTRAILAMTGQGAIAKGPRPVRAPMPGLVVRVNVTPGDQVEAGQSIVIIEAMKMENDLKAHRAGVVATIAVESGQAVEIGDLLLTIEDDGDGE